MKNIRLKTALHPQQIRNRMKFNPEIMELHLKEEHLYDPEPMIHYIQEFKSKGVRVYLHHPMTYKGQYLDIISQSQEMRDYYDWSCKVLASICKQEKIKCIVHCHYVQSESSHYRIKQKEKKRENELKRY